MLTDKTIIKVNDGEVFEGTLAHWQDVFFSNPTEENIKEYCKHMGWEVKFIEVKTQHIFPPIPSRNWDWCAYDDNRPDRVVGWGRTEKEAIADFFLIIEEENLCN